MQFGIQQRSLLAILAMQTAVIQDFARRKLRLFRFTEIAEFGDFDLALDLFRRFVEVLHEKDVRLADGRKCALDSGKDSLLRITERPSAPRIKCPLGVNIPRSSSIECPYYVRRIHL